MSALELLRSRVLAAKEAVNNVAALDDMAKGDSYVNSEGLKLSGRKGLKFADNDQRKRELPTVVDDLSDRFVDALSTAARPRPRTPLPRETLRNLEKVSPKELTGETTADTSMSISSGLGSSATPSLKSKRSAAGGTNAGGDARPPKPVRPVRRQSPEVVILKEHAHILHQLDYESDESSSDECMTGETSSSRRVHDGSKDGVACVAENLEHELDTIRREIENVGEPSPRHEHRFMQVGADLEAERGALLQSLEMNRPPMAVDGKESDPGDLWNNDKSNPGYETQQALRSGLSWVQRVASPQLERLGRQIMHKVEQHQQRSSPDTRSVRRPAIGPRQDPMKSMADPEEEAIIVTTSSTFLSMEEREEMERLAQLHSSPTTLSGLVHLWSCFFKNPRLTFAWLTLVLSIFAYLYSRKRSVDDVL